MTTPSKLIVTLAFTAIGAFANDHLIQIRDQARGLEQEFRGIHAAAKAKKFDAAEMQARLEATASGVDKLKTLVAGFEAATPHLTAGADWKKTKDLVTLIDIFHAQKAELLGPDGIKNKGLLKSHADGLARRALVLQESADRLLKNLGS